METQSKSNWIRMSKQEVLNKKKVRHCNLCTSDFMPRTRFDRYCSNCRSESDLLKFSEWLPSLDEVLHEKISA